LAASEISRADHYGPKNLSKADADLREGARIA
jgi:hypothetical protein